MDRLTNGSGWRCPKDGDAVLISLSLARAGGDIVEDGSDFEYTLGSGGLGPISTTVDKVLLNMKKGAQGVLRCSKDYSDVDKTPDGSIIRLTLMEFLEVVDISSDKRG